MNVENVPLTPVVDKARASRDGHFYHEIWAAHAALELLHPSTTLSAIAIEGFSMEDESSLSNEAIEIADLVRYRGANNVNSASSIEVLQFKYSHARQDVGMRAFDIKKTLQKFAKADADLTEKIGVDAVDDIVRYEIITNRPISPALISAFNGISRGTSLSGEDSEQAEYIKIALSDVGDRIPSLLKRTTLSGAQGSLSDARTLLHRTLAGWTVPNDTMARVRLLKLRELVREKTLVQAKGNNLVDRVAVLACFEVEHERDLFPTPEAFPSLSKVIDRPATAELIAEIKSAGYPILVDAPGGMGKTVLMQSLAQVLSPTDSVVLFDCYGGGSWRDPADGRHLPEKALPHIANILASLGLCEILIPGTPGPDLVRTFRERLTQAVDSLHQANREASVILILDAIDNAAQQAAVTHSKCFAHELLLSLSINPISSVHVVASCRTERRDLACGTANCRRFEVPALSESEAFAIAQAHQSDVTRTEAVDLRSRSGSNPRVFVALLKAGRPFDAHRLADRDDQKNTLLDSLIWDQFTKAKGEAEGRGVPSAEIDALLASLAMLPLPVPVSELAAAQSLSEAAVTSFAADLHPLIAQSQRGLIFADEPTETLIQRKFENATEAREVVIHRLKGRQDESTYAARALPVVLTALDRTDDLIQLAFEDRLPRAATSRVAQRAIRLSRLVAALVACAQRKRNDDLTKLLVEASRVAGGNERSDRFLQDHPDLVAIANDTEALRRLFETRTSWAGRKHAALSIAYALSDDFHEARRNAQRAFDWLNWRTNQRDERGAHQLPGVDELDRFGPSYWAVLNGNASRVIRWIEQWNEDYGFALFSQIISLLEHHSKDSIEAKTLQRKLYLRVCHCRSKSRPLFAALLHTAALSSEQTKRLIVLLARASSVATPIAYRYPGPQPEFSFTQSLLSAATKAVRLGMDIEARRILDATDLKRPGLSEFDSDFWIHESIEPFLLAGCIKAAIEHRLPTLMDICPKEIDVQIRRSTARKTATSFERAVEALLKQRKSARKKRKSKDRIVFDNEERAKALKTLEHRVRPLLSYASAVTTFIRSSIEDSKIESTIASLAKETASTHSYPYRNTPRYIAGICFPLVFNTLDALGSFSDGTAKAVSEWLAKSPIANTSVMTFAVSRFSRREETGNTAFALARHIEKKISAETDTSLRINGYGALARAIWLASRSEAQAYFRRGLEFADALGSGDSEKIAELNEFAAQYRGQALSPELTHSFSRICELNLPEEAEKFVWLDFSKAMSRICGPASLAVVARFADREKVDLSYSLPCLLTSLVKDQRIAPELAGALIGLDEPVETWSWTLADFLEAILPTIAIAHRETIVEFVLREIDRQYCGSPPSQTLTSISTAAQKYLLAGSDCLHVIMSMQAQVIVENGARDFMNSVPTPRNPESAIPILEDLDFANPKALDDAMNQQNAADAGSRSQVRFLRDVGQSVKGVDDRRRFLEAVSQTEIPSLLDKLSAIKELVSEWQTVSTAISDLVPDLTKQLAIRHVSELVDSDWNSSYVLRSLIAFSGQSGEELIPLIIVALRQHAQFVGSVTWLKFGTIMAKVASDGAIQDALHRFLKYSAAELPIDLGDGPWNSNLLAPQSDVEIVAALIWLRLGSPRADARWRAAHVVRRLVRLGRSDVLTFLVARIGSTDAGAFQDRTLPFFYLHARLWLLISLARIALESPELIAPFKDEIGIFTFDATFPHVLIQHFGKLILGSVSGVLSAQERERMLATLEPVNVSPFPREKEHPDHRPNSRNSQAVEPPERINDFHFDYDFEKYEVDGVARMFELPKWQVGNACITWVRKWSSGVESMYACPRGKTNFRDHSRNWSSASPPSHDRWGGYLAWHALMLTTGEFLKARPIVGFSHDEQPWDDWLKEHVLSTSDGLWLADATDSFPTDVNRSFGPTDSTQDWVSATSVIMGGLAGLTSDMSLGQDLVVEGHWRRDDKIDFSIQSVIVPNAEVQNIAFATGLAEPFFRYLPREDYYGSHNKDSLLNTLITKWVSVDSGDTLRLDRYDPYCSSSALQRPRPSTKLVQELGLTPQDSCHRIWLSSTRTTVFTAAAWGSKSGSGEHETENSGARLFCRTKFLKTFLESQKSQLVLLIRAQKYLEKPRQPLKGKFRTQTLIVIISSRGGVKFIQRFPKRARTAVKELSSQDRDSFEPRLIAIRKAMKRE